MKKIDMQLVSKYRTELMGIAMLNVLVLHGLDFANITGYHWLVLLLKTFGRLVFTEGFLFLSGFGLYYSFHKDSDLSHFYVKRVKRLLIPYIMITLPFLLWHCIAGDFSVGILLMKLSTLYFWFHGNDGMWYISLSVLLYILYPMLHVILRRRGGDVCLFFLSCLIIASLYYLVPDYYKMIQIGISKIPFFILGMYIAKCALNEKRFHGIWIIVIGACWGLSYIIPIPEWINVKESIIRLMGISLCLWILRYLSRYMFLLGILRWFGRYSLEIYILHILFAWSLLKTDIRPDISVSMIMIFTLLLVYPVSKYSKIF